MHPEGSEGTWRDLPKLLADSLRLVWSAGRREFLITSSLQLASALAIAAQLFVAQAVISSVLAAGGSDDFASLLPALAALVAITVALDFMQAIEAEQSRVLGELVGRRALDRVLDVSTRIDLLAFESPEFYDRLQRARAQGQFRSMQTVNGLLGILGSSITAVTIVIALAALQPLLLPLVILGYVPLWVVASLNSRDLYRFMRGMTPNERQRNYLGRVLMDRNPAKEVRSFRLAGYLRGRYDRLYDERIVELRSLARRRLVRSLLGSFLSAVITAATVGSLAWLYVSGRMSLPAAGAAVFGLYQLAGRLRGLYFSATSLYEATLFIRDYSSFLTLEPSMDAQGKRRAPRGFERLAVEDVSFTYPESRPTGGATASRSRSGRARSSRSSARTARARRRSPRCSPACTGPTTAAIRWDGVDVAEVDRDELRDSIAVIFQDFERYQLPARENIGLGRHERIDDLDAIRVGGRGARRRRRLPRRAARGLRDDARPGVRRRLRPLDRPVAAGRARARVLPRRALRDPRRAHRRARRARRERAVRPHARAARRPLGGADLAPLLERAQRGPDLRPARRPRRRAGRPRRADGRGRPLRGAVHPPGPRVSRHQTGAKPRGLSSYRCLLPGWVGVRDGSRSSGPSRGPAETGVSRFGHVAAARRSGIHGGLGGVPALT